MKNKLHFIFAGAGSGKTHFLTTHLARLLVENQSNLKPDQIMVSTFTRAAATEIRNRVLKEVAASGGNAELLMALRSAEINTIHGLGLSLIKRHWFRLSISPEPQVMEEEDGGAFIRRMLQEMPMDSKITHRLAELNRILNLFSSKGFGEYHPFAWREQLAKLIELALANGINDLSEKSLSFQESLNWLRSLYPNGNIPNTFQEGQALGKLDISVELLKEASNELRELQNHPERKGNARSINALSPKYSKLLSFSPRRYSDFLELKKVFQNKKNEFVPAFTDNPHILSAGYRIVEIIDGITQDSTFIGHCQEYIRLIFRLANICLTHYTEYKKTNNLIDYSDMERYFRNLLQFDEVKEEIRNSIKLVMVDEFQDCSPLQVEIFRELALLAADNYWVGDPKQAIYGFRGTDSVLIRQTVEELSRQVGAFAKMEVSFGILKSGFRSVPELVELSNRIFSELLATQNQPLRVQKDLVRGDENSKEFTNWKESTFGINSHADIAVEDLIQLFASRESIGEPHLLRLDTVTNADTPEDGIVLAVRHLLNPVNKIKVGIGSGNNKRELRKGDIAILCRDNSQVNAFVKILKENGIPVSEQGADFYNEPEFRLMHNLFFLIEKPWDSLAKTNLELLLGKMSREETGNYLLEQHKLGIRRAEAAKLEYEGAEGNQFEELYMAGIHPVVAECYRRSDVLGVAEIASRLISGMDLLHKVSEWSSSEQRRRNLLHFISLCDKFQDSASKAGKPASINDFLIWLESNKDDFKSASGSDADAVNVLTFHKAKGLEWPVIIPVGTPGTLDKLSKIDELYKACFIGSENGTEKHIRFAFNPFGKTLAFPGNASEHFSEDVLENLFRGNREEHLRLMYVAVTRARDLLVDLNFKPSRNGPKYIGFSALFPEPLDEEDLNFPIPTAAISGQEMAPFAQAINYFSPQEVPTAEGRPFFLQPSKAGNTGATNAVIETVKNFESRITVEQVNKDAWNGIQDRKDEMLGNLLHAVFYLEDIQSLSTNDFMRMAGGLFSITEDNLQTLRKRHQIFFEWCHELAGENCLIHRELPLEYQENGQIWTGTADLVLEGKNGVFLIDYKSYQGGEGEITGIGEHSARRYYGQLSAYRTMLKATMDEPRAFREMMIFYPMSGLMVKLIDKL